MRGSCIAGFWTQGFSTIYTGKPVGLGKYSEENWFRTDKFWFRSVIAFPVCLSQFRLMKNGRESLKLTLKKGLKTWNPNFSLDVSNQENRRMPFQTFCLFQEFSTETSKATRNWVNGKPGKAPKCPLGLFEWVKYKVIPGGGGLPYETDGDARRKFWI